MKFCPKCARTRGFSRHIFLAHFVGFLFSSFFPFSLIFLTLSRKWRPTLFALKLRHLIFWFSGHSVKEIVKLLTKVWMIKVNKWSKVKTLEDKTSSVWPSFFQWVRNVIEKAVSIWVINLHDTMVKKTSNSQYQSFEHNGMKIYVQQRLDNLALKRKRRRTCRHDVRRIWKLYSKGRRASKLTWCEPSGDHLDYRWRVNIQRTNKEPAPK